MDLYLDDCSDDGALAAFLRQHGHRVFTPRSEHIRGADDPDHLSHAADHNYALITQDPEDFLALHRAWQALGRSHGGILLVYRENNKAKDMTPQEIAFAINRLLGSGLPIANEVHVLNHWRP